MSSKPTFWQRIGLHDWFLNKPETRSFEPAAMLTPDAVYNYIVQQFRESIGQLSFADRIIFYHEFIIVFNAEDYAGFMEHKKGLFGHIVQESVQKFYEILKEYKAKGKTVVPSASKWVFRFVSHPDYARGDKGFIGKLQPGTTQRTEQLRVTFIPRQTGLAETADLSAEMLHGFTYYTEGYYEVPFRMEDAGSTQQQSFAKNIARFEVILPDKAYAGRKLEYTMRTDDLVVTGDESTADAAHAFRIPSEWVDTPHLRIRYNRNEDRFYLAAFGEKTVVNEREVRRSDPDAPGWTELPLHSRIVLNGIIGLNFYKA